MTFIRSDITAVKLYEEYVLAGIGSGIYVYEKGTGKFNNANTNILEGQKIYGIVPNSDNSKLLVFGGKQFEILKRQTQGTSLFDFSPGAIVCDDWVHSCIWISEESIALLTAHNVVQMWCISNKPTIISRTVNKDNSILYSGLLLPLVDDVLVFSGTVFSEVIISRCKKEQSLNRLIGHKGVIFSISCCLRKELIVTTSDDRSLRVWAFNGTNENYTSKYWDSVNISCVHALYGHSARVMRSCISSEYILSVGEDSAVCFWDFEGKLVRKVDIHQNAPIWSVDVDDSNFVTGGGDCGVRLHPLSIATGLCHSDVLQIGRGTPKQLVFTGRGNIVILTESAELIYHDLASKTETLHSLNHESTYLMMAISSCRQIIAVADMNANLDIFIENCKGPAGIHNIIRKKLPVGRVLSMHWAGNRHLAFCSDNGEIHLIASKSDQVEVVERFLLPHCKERWLTSVALNNVMLLVGDRCGNVHCYLKGNPNPFVTFGKVHGRYGPTSIRIESDGFITTGRDGTLKYFSIESKVTGYKIKLIRSQEVGFQWVEKCIDTDGNLVCGFHERTFVVTDLRNSSKIIEVTCGGGHRSWDVVRSIEEIENSYEQIIKLIYLKNSDVNIETFDLNKILSTDIIKGTHSKEINCLRAYTTDLDESVIYYISGGEDTTLRISSTSGNTQFNDEVVLKQLSNVRTLRICKIDEDKLLIVSGGGRAQICVRLIKFRTKNGQVKAVVEDLTDFLVRGTDKERKGDKNWRNCSIDFDPETRIMDLEIIEIDKENFFVYTACSDAYIRVFELKYSNARVTFKLFGQLTYHKTCVLKTYQIKLSNRKVLATCTTRGEVCLWDVTNYSCTSIPIAVFRTNKSGINCVSSKVISDTEFLIATGGDDNTVHLNLIKTDCDLSSAEIDHIWSSDKLHCSQITGLIIIDDILVTASIDQRVAVLRIKDNLEVDFLYQVMTDIADVQGIDLVGNTDEILTVCVFGKGLQTLLLSTKQH